MFIIFLSIYITLLLLVTLRPAYLLHHGHYGPNFQIYGHYWENFQMFNNTHLKVFIIVISKFSMMVMEIRQKYICTVVPNNQKMAKFFSNSIFADKTINRESTFSRNGRQI